MPRIYKGSETILKLLIDVPSTSVIDKIKIALFTTDRSIAMEFYADSITLYGNIAYLNAPEWTFMEMQDGIINYIAQGESDNKPFIFERQSNYILKTSDGFEMSEIMNGYYTKEETDEKLEEEQDKLISGKTIKTINGESVLGSGNIEIHTDLTDYYTKVEVDEIIKDIDVNVDADLTGYATEQWVKNQDYATNSDVDEFVGDRVGQVEQKFVDYYTKVEVDEMLTDIEVDVDLTGYATQQWVKQQGYVTDFDVNDYVGNEIGQLEEIINTKQDELISGTNIKTINGNDILGEGDITIEGGGDLSNYYTKAEIDGMIGDINNILTSI